MSNTKKIAISLPAQLVKKVEKIMKQTGESRSAVIKRSIETALEKEKAEIRVRKYIEGYLKYPETDDDKRFADTASKAIFEEEVWE